MEILGRPSLEEENPCSLVPEGESTRRHRDPMSDSFQRARPDAFDAVHSLDGRSHAPGGAVRILDGPELVRTSGMAMQV